MLILRDDHSERIQYDDPDYPVYVRRSFLSAFPQYAAPSH